jgi:hypothetical protein
MSVVGMLPFYLTRFRTDPRSPCVTLRRGSLMVATSHAQRFKIGVSCWPNNLYCMLRFSRVYTTDRAPTLTVWLAFHHSLNEFPPFRDVMAECRGTIRLNDYTSQAHRCPDPHGSICSGRGIPTILRDPASHLKSPWGYGPCALKDPAKPADPDYTSPLCFKLS